jgi:hypothetical protein
MRTSLGFGTEPGTQRETAIVSRNRVQTFMLQRVDENLDQSGTLHSYCVFQIAGGGRKKKVGGVQREEDEAEEDKGRLRDFRLQPPADAFSFLYTFICELIDHVYHSSKNDSSAININAEICTLLR